MINDKGDVVVVRPQEYLADVGASSGSKKTLMGWEMKAIVSQVKPESISLSLKDLPDTSSNLKSFSFMILRQTDDITFVLSFS